MDEFRGMDACKLIDFKKLSTLVASHYYPSQSQSQEQCVENKVMPTGAESYSDKSCIPNLEGGKISLCNFWERGEKYFVSLINGSAGWPCLERQRRKTPAAAVVILHGSAVCE